MEFALFCAVAYIAIVCTYIALVDAERMIIPNRLNVALALGGLVASLLLAPVDPPASVAGALVGGVGAWLFRVAYLRWRRIDGIGLGDVKFLAAAGTWVGPLGLAPLLLIAASSSLALVAFSGKGIGPTERIPFGPFLCLGLLSVALPQLLSQVTILDLVLP